MSNAAINWAISRTGMPSSAKYILILLANAANKHTWEAYPSVRCLVSWSALNRKTITDGLKLLLDRGMIADTGKRKGRTKQVLVYRVTPSRENALGKGSETGTLLKGAQNRQRTVPILTSKSPNFDLKESQKRDTEPLSNPNESNRKRRRKSSDRDRRCDLPLLSVTSTELLTLYPECNPAELLEEFNEARRGRFETDRPQQEFISWVEATKGSPLLKPTV